MKYLAIMLLSLSLILGAITPSWAVIKNDDGSIAEIATSTGSGGQCDLTAYKESLFGTESASSGGYTAANSIGATGKYQFMPGTAAMLESYKNADSGCKTMGQRYAGLAQEACGPVQEAMMDEFTMKNLKTLKKNCPAAEAAVSSGKMVQGYKIINNVKQMTPGCRVSWSGILAGAHLGGASGVCTVLSTGADRDDKGKNKNGTSVMHYICAHKDLPVPGEDCSPKQYPRTQVPDVIKPWEGGITPSASSGIGNFNSLSTALKSIWVGAFQLMTERLTTTMMQQVQIIGTFFDAKHQLETQRLMQQRYAEAHKDYHPSEQMCEIGTFVRNLSNSEQRAKLTQTALTRAMLDRALRTGEVKTFKTGSDDDTRLKGYINKFCNIEDNAKQNERLCKDSGEPEQQNADINFTQTIDAPLTLNINLLDSETKPEEENLFAFLDYIFMNDAFPWLTENKTVLHKFIEPYQDMRSLVAIRSVAQNSFAHIIAQKTQGPDKEDESVGPFIKALMREMGVEDLEIEKVIGKNPSYYAQMEILTKKIYQHPEFISNLYDKPANVKRIRTAMTAIKLMQDRDIHNALMRREMLMSILLELKLRNKQQILTNEINLLNATPPGEARTGNNGTYGSGENNPYGVGTYNSKTGAGGF